MAYEVMTMEEVTKGIVKVSDGYELEMFVTGDTVNAITNYTNNIDDTLLLLTYLYGRAETYNTYIKTQREIIEKMKKQRSMIDDDDDLFTCPEEFNCSEEFMELLITSLLSDTTYSKKFIPHEAYNADQIYDALDSLNDSELFGDIGSQKPLDYVNNITLLIKQSMYGEDSSYLVDQELEEEEIGKRKKLIDEWD